jgi:hypothetical protein
VIRVPQATVDRRLASYSVWVSKTQFPCKSAHSQTAIRVPALATSGLGQTDVLIEACSSGSSACGCR